MSLWRSFRDIRDSAVSKVTSILTFSRWSFWFGGVSALICIRYLRRRIDFIAPQSKPEKTHHEAGEAIAPHVPIVAPLTAPESIPVLSADVLSVASKRPDDEAIVDVITDVDTASTALLTIKANAKTPALNWAADLPLESWDAAVFVLGDLVCKP